MKCTFIFGHIVSRVVLTVVCTAGENEIIIVALDEKKCIVTDTDTGKTYKNYKLG